MRKVKFTDPETGMKIELSYEDKAEQDIYTHVPLSINGHMNVIQKADTQKERIIAGYASVIEVDRENQLIPKSTLEQGIQTLLQNSDYANLMITHNNIQVGKVLDSWNDLNTHVDDNGLFIVASIRSDLEIANEIWNRILSKEITGFSIAAEVLLDHDECDAEKCVTVIDKMNVFEISICDSPINQKSGFIVISKSCDICDKEKESTMAKKKVTKAEEPTPVEEKSEDEEECTTCTEEKSEEVETPTEEKSEEPELDMKAIINSLTQEIEAIKGTLETLKAEPMDEEEEDMEEEDMEEKSEEPVQIEEPVEEKAEEPIEEKAEETIVEPSPETYATKADFDALKASIDNLIKSFDKSVAEEDLKIAIKSKDDEICALSKRIEVLEKSEKPKAKVEKVPEAKDQVKDKSFKSKLKRDPIRPGTIYKDE